MCVKQKTRPSQNPQIQTRNLGAICFKNTCLSPLLKGACNWITEGLDHAVRSLPTSQSSCCQGRAHKMSLIQLEVLFQEPYHYRAWNCANGVDAVTEDSYCSLLLSDKNASGMSCVLVWLLLSAGNSSLQSVPALRWCPPLSCCTSLLFRTCFTFLMKQFHVLHWPSIGALWSFPLRG